MTATATATVRPQHIIMRVRDGKKKDQQKLDEQLALGYAVQESKHVDGNYKFGKTCCLGFLFLPLALLGKGRGYTEYVLTIKA